MDAARVAFLWWIYNYEWRVSLGSDLIKPTYFTIQPSCSCSIFQISSCKSLIRPHCNAPLPSGSICFRHCLFCKTKVLLNGIRFHPTCNTLFLCNIYPKHIVSYVCNLTNSQKSSRDIDQRWCRMLHYVEKWDELNWNHNICPLQMVLRYSDVGGVYHWYVKYLS